MDIQHLKHLLDACFTAKHIIETMPKLPKGMKPRHIHVLDQIYIACETHGECRVSNVSDGLNITMPSVTKLAQELENMQLIEKYPNKTDKRVTLLRLTEPGLSFVRKYVLDFHARWADNLSSVTNDEVQKAIEILTQLEHTMPDIPEEP